MSGKLTLYGFRPSPPTRAVLLTLKALNLDFTFEVVNTLNGDQMKPEFLAKNPQHKIPLLEEADGTCISDSHAICAYLARRYGKDDSLYPKDFYQRAVVDQRLHFENGVIFSSCLGPIVGPIFRGTISKAEFDEKLTKVYETYDLLEKFLDENNYMAGNTLTIADLSIVSSVHSLTFVAPIVDAKWPKLAAWLKRMAELPYYAEANTSGLEVFVNFLKEKIPLLK